MALTAEIVKAKARELGADGVGIADAAVLNAHPPDAAYPQIPVRVSPEIKSCVAFFKRIPAGAFRARDNACIHHVDQLVLREMDRVGYRIARFLEAHDHWAFQTAAQETVWEMKSASYGYLSTRHVAIEAGLGTIGPGIGVGYIFGKVIESVTRQPEMRDEITSIQWLGFALTEAIVFYAFIFGLIAYFLSGG